MSVGALFGVFALMFVLELPDKTMVATIVMSTRARPSAVALGASAGFVVQMALAVVAGSVLALLPTRVKDVVVGVLFLAGACYLLFISEAHEQARGVREGQGEVPRGALREALTAFTVIFIGEFGDLTQIQAANFSAKTHAPLDVFVAASLALCCVAFVGAYGGALLQRVIPLAKIRLGGGLIFLALGIATFVSLVRS